MSFIGTNKRFFNELTSVTNIANSWWRDQFHFFCNTNNSIYMYDIISLKCPIPYRRFFIPLSKAIKNQSHTCTFKKIKEKNQFWWCKICNERFIWCPKKLIPSQLLITGSTRSLVHSSRHLQYVLVLCSFSVRCVG